jgi:single-strand DNA-binding protein
VTHFSLAVNRVWKDQSGQRQEATDWFQVEAWGRLGEICQQYLKKGRLVYLDGRLRTSQWQDKDGETHYRTVVVARSLQMLGRPPEEPAELAEPVEEEPEPEK